MTEKALKASLWGLSQEDNTYVADKPSLPSTEITDSLTQSIRPYFRPPSVLKYFCRCVEMKTALIVASDLLNARRTWAPTFILYRLWRFCLRAKFSADIYSSATMTPCKRTFTNSFSMRRNPAHHPFFFLKILKKISFAYQKVSREDNTNVTDKPLWMSTKEIDSLGTHSGALNHDHKVKILMLY